MNARVLSAYGFPSDVSVTPHGSGLINRTWLIRSAKGDYILQQLNRQVFVRPDFIAENIELVGQYLTEHYPGIVFPRPVRATGGETLVDAGSEGHYRLYPFIDSSVTIDVVHTPAEAFEAARQFGGFTRMLAGFDAKSLHETLPGFHDLPLRYRDFRDALGNGRPDRIQRSVQLIDYLKAQHHLVTEYANIRTNPGFKLRVTHHDTKISNVLFDRQGKGICVIDLDTVMPGYFISDVGDMLRTYLSPVSEEEKDLSLIRIRMPYFRAIVEGYLEEMSNELTPMETRSFVYAGSFMMYMQALRFITDYLRNDVYYGSKYEDQNFVRAMNQATLLRLYLAESARLQNIVRDVVAKMTA
ncbi:MAG TPA: aminoglycoside phosphotransferase family protein [Puia sp.]|jgi:Ser/Thr protein kinase RdoA (MazF antagonist)|nr:aminoglycoside phosphotransferase family protein [Puia sp.]